MFPLRPRTFWCFALPLLLLLQSGCGSGIVKTGQSYFEPVTAVASYAAFGDSISADVPVSIRSWPAYPTLLGPLIKLATMDDAYSGDQACDLFRHQFVPNGIGYATATRTLYSLTVGTNDLDIKGAGAYEPVYQNCLGAALAWLGTTRSDKLLAGDDGVTTTGGCNAAADSDHFGAMYCTAGRAGAVTFDAFFTLQGRPLYLWYSYSDQAAAGSTLSVSVDGASPITASSRPPVPILTQNGTSSSIGMLRLPVSAGLHHIVINTNTGDVGVLGLGSTRSPNAPVLLLGDIPTELLDNPLASPTAQGRYSADIISNFYTALGDGLKIYFAPDRETMLGTTPEMADQVHPSALGQQHMLSAFQLAIKNAVNTGDLILPK